MDVYGFDITEPTNFSGTVEIAIKGDILNTNTIEEFKN